MESEAKETAVRIGVIADTHGLLREAAVRALEGCQHILHAGDVGKPEVLQALTRIAPVTAVRGNVDTGAWAQALPVTQVVTVGSAMLYLIHILEELDINPAAAGFNAVIYGHSHRYHEERNAGVLYLNPGSAGPRRFGKPVSLAILQVNGDQLSVDYVALGSD